MFATDRCHQLDDPWRDAAVAVRFHEEDASLAAIVEAARSTPIRRRRSRSAIGPSYSRRGPPQALGSPGIRLTAAAASVNKKRLARRSRRAGLPVPWFFEAIRASDAWPPIARVPIPCVIKPLGLSGSRGVIRANDPAELVRRGRAAAGAAVTERRARHPQRSRGHDPDRGFIDGREFAIEGVLTRRRVPRHLPSSTSQIRWTARSSRRRSTSRRRALRRRDAGGGRRARSARRHAALGLGTGPSMRNAGSATARRLHARGRGASDRRALLEGAAVRRSRASGDAIARRCAAAARGRGGHVPASRASRAPRA